MLNFKNTPGSCIRMWWVRDKRQDRAVSRVILLEYIATSYLESLVSLVYIYLMSEINNKNLLNQLSAVLSNYSWIFNNRKYMLKIEIKSLHRIPKAFSVNRNGDRERVRCCTTTPLKVNAVLISGKVNVLCSDLRNLRNYAIRVIVATKCRVIRRKIVFHRRV